MLVGLQYITNGGRQNVHGSGVTRELRDDVRLLISAVVGWKLDMASGGRLCSVILECDKFACYSTRRK